MAIYTFSGGHIRWSLYLVVTRLLASAGPVARTTCVSLDTVPSL